MNDFFETTKQFISLSPESIKVFSAILKKMELPKGHVLVKADTICNYVYYIEKGLSRTYYLKDGKDITE
jgi:CRP-like cAMP-binding protein